MSPSSTTTHVTFPSSVHSSVHSSGAYHHHQHHQHGRQLSASMNNHQQHLQIHHHQYTQRPRSSTSTSSSTSSSSTFMYEDDEEQHDYDNTFVQSSHETVIDDKYLLLIDQMQTKNIRPANHSRLSKRHPLQQQQQQQQQQADTTAETPLDNGTHAKSSKLAPIRARTPTNTMKPLPPSSSSSGNPGEKRYKSASKSLGTVTKRKAVTTNQKLEPLKNAPAAGPVNPELEAIERRISQLKRGNESLRRISSLLSSTPSSLRSLSPPRSTSQQHNTL